MVYLRRFADREGQQFLRQFHRDYRGLAPPAILKRVAERARYLRPRLAAAYRTILPSVTEPEFARLIDRFATDKPADAAAMRKLYHSHRSEERRVGKEVVRMCRSRWSPESIKKQTRHHQ